jgi:hypothetical protein
MTYYYNYSKKSKYIKNKIIDDTNINYFENYKDLTINFLKPFENKSFLEVINKIYDDDELKLNDELKLINVDEYKFLIQSLITIDYNNLKVKKYENIRLKLFNHLKESDYTMKDLLRFLNMIEPIFNNLLVFTEKNYTYAQASYLYNILSDFENNNLFEDWKLKYLVFIIKIFKLFDVPIIKTHEIKKYWMNKYNFEQRRDFIEWDLDDCGTFEKMGEGALFYYKDVVEKDEELIKINQYEFLNNEILNKYNNLFIEKSNKIKPIKRNTKQKINNVVSVF